MQELGGRAGRFLIDSRAILLIQPFLLLACEPAGLLVESGCWNR